MKKLSNFIYFDFESFIKGKKLLSIGQQEWKDFNTGNTLGTKVEVVIAKDTTEYDLKDGEQVSNIYEKMTIKVEKAITVPMNTEVIPVNAYATVYGEYRNQLSIIADDIKVVTKQ